MSTTTEVLSEREEGSSVPDSDQNHLKQTPTSNKRRKAHFTANKLPDDICAEIEELYRCIPQIEEVFQVVDRIGSGTFSSVYLADLRQYPHVKQQFALKHIIPTSHPSRIENELHCLQEIGGCDYVMGVKACIRQKDHVVIVMPYFPHDRFQDYVQSMSIAEIRDYMRALLTALRRVHEVNVIHRDVKPSNFLYNRNTKQYSLVDFGLAMKVPGLKETKEEKESNDKKDIKNEERKPTRTSPRTTRNRTVEKQSPKKPKLNQDDAENQSEAPNKIQASSSVKKRLSNEMNRLTEVDINIEKTKEENTTTPAGKQNYVRTVKSPRRMLLTKRALQTQGGGVVFQKAAGANSNSKPGAVQRTGRYKTGSGIGSCACYGKPQICSVCIARSSQHAPRAGTQGFRSPEVLMKYPDQTTAVDTWSAGVILLSLLSGRYPFFKAQDDVSALAQIISVFGTDNMQKAALTFGKHLLSQPAMPSLDLHAMCLKLRGIKATPRRKVTSSDKDSLSAVPEDAFDLLRGLLDLCPHTRLTAEQALLHPFFTQT